MVINTALGQLCLCWRCWCSFLFLVISGNWAHLNFTVEKIKKKGTHPQTVLFHVGWIIHKWADGSAHIATNRVSLHISTLLLNVPYSVPPWLKQYTGETNKISLSTTIPRLHRFIKMVPSEAIMSLELCYKIMLLVLNFIISLQKHERKSRTKAAALFSWNSAQTFCRAVVGGHMTQGIKQELCSQSLYLIFSDLEKITLCLCLCLLLRWE